MKTAKTTTTVVRGPTNKAGAGACRIDGEHGSGGVLCLPIPRCFPFVHFSVCAWIFNYSGEAAGAVSAAILLSTPIVRARCALILQYV